MNKTLIFTIAYAVSTLFVFYFGYKKGVQITEARMQIVTNTAQNKAIDKAVVANEINNQAIKMRESTIVKIITQEKIVFKKAVCESNGISNDVIDVLNKKD